LPSGWKTTSIFGSLFNTFIIRSALDLLQIKVDYLAVHGDDVDLEVQSRGDAINLLLTLKDFGFDVSPLKTSIGTKLLP
jgi:hypothetical protein